MATIRSVFFHEDDYGQVEILPTAARPECLREMGRIATFAEAHRDGLGFTDIYLRGEPSVSLASLDIALVRLRSAIPPFLPPFDQVYTDYSSHRESCPSVFAWGLDDNAALFAGVREDGVVQALWLSLHGVPAGQFEAWSHALRLLPRSSDLILADWSRGEVVLLDDHAGLVAYLSGFHT